MRSEASISNNVKSVRARLELSQQQLADAAGIARQTIGGIEAGQYAPSAAVALRIARALGCTVEELFWLEEDLPTVYARSVDGSTILRESRVSIARVGQEWIAYPLDGESAFRSEMVPADGLTSVAEDGRLAVKLLDEQDQLARTVVIAGCTPALSLWARSAERWHPGLRVHWIHANSTVGLQLLARGDVHASGIHLANGTEPNGNMAAVQSVIPGVAVSLVNLGVWSEGFAVAAGNPQRILTALNLARSDVRIVNREQGSGARALLDSVLSDAGVGSDGVCGYSNIVQSHEAVARAIRDGHADAGVTTESIAQAFGLGFVPLRKVPYDLAIRRDHMETETVRQLLATLQHRWVRTQLAVLGGYDTTRTGEVVHGP